MTWPALGTAFFMAIGFFLMFGEPSGKGESIISSVVGLLSILFFGVGFCYSLVKMKQQQSSFVVSEHGFVDSTLYTSGGLIAWKDVENILMYEWISLAIPLNQLYIMMVCRWKQASDGLSHESSINE